MTFRRKAVWTPARVWVVGRLSGWPTSFPATSEKITCGCDLVSANPTLISPINPKSGTRTTNRVAAAAGRIVVLEPPLPSASSDMARKQKADAPSTGPRATRPRRESSLEEKLTLVYMDRATREAVLEEEHEIPEGPGVQRPLPWSIFTKTFWLLYAHRLAK